MSPAEDSLPPPAPSMANVRERLQQWLGAPIVREFAVSGGYTPALRFRIETASGDRGFVKVAVNPYTRRALIREAEVLSALQALGMPFVPQLIAVDPDPIHPLLVLEDLGDARWPPPWDEALVESVLSTLRELHKTPTTLPSYAEVHPEEDHGWLDVAADPQPFLDLGLVSGAWLDASLSTLVAAERNVETRGSTLTHFDLRSDNLCQSQRGVVIIDWNFACAGNPLLDLGFWLPSLSIEGGPSPETLIGEQPEIAAFVSGFFAARAGQPPIPSAPHVRPLQIKQLRAALAWALPALGLRPTRNVSA